ncbi:ethanolamine utilization protein EutH [Clostridium cellulovorans]|uniref:Ethanolamine utilization protein EutH n=1 Tax=Clostridium cellulovorans (strain ATCC 35296 / DSM 3052 / OCM 3 / 743B) TaxID=573061 RepID=D9SMW9_CLOC7|nr:ethanolamine utilization protein EutH [Clostridium cellulovorans]ADL51835.1 ethanolamine utilization protein EutH [Clostridium cellulovorans 743B]
MDKLILYIVGSFFIIGGIDYILGSPLKLGLKFEEGIKTMGPLGIGMVGIYSLAPLVSNFLITMIVPICKELNLDPSIFPATFLAVDMGGYQMATKLALTEEMGTFSGIIIASTLGSTISFSIPVALGMLSKEDESYFSKGVIVGIITIPIGCFIAGMWLKIQLITLFWNLLPIYIFIILLVIGLIKTPGFLMKCFNIFGKLIMSFSIIGLLFQGIDSIFGVKVIYNMAPLSESITIVSKISFVLAGAYPMLALINHIFKDSFKRIGDRFGINSASISGLLGNLASNLLIFGTYKEMNPKGKIICTAFSVSGAFVFGGQFGFVSGIAPKMIGAFILSKLVAGITSIVLANWLYEHEQGKISLEL